MMSPTMLEASDTCCLLKVNHLINMLIVIIIVERVKIGFEKEITAEDGIYGLP